MTIIDSHVHIWDRHRFHYPWLGQFPDLNRDFLPGDIDVHTAPISGMVFVQADCARQESIAEAEWVNSLATEWPNLAGIVAFAPVDDEVAVTPHLEALASLPRVVGVRRLIEGSPASLMTSESFVAGLRAVESAGYAFDVCVTHEQLAQVVELKRKLPGLRMVLDHLGKPPVATGFASAEAQEWARQLRALSREPNAYVKISGLSPEADPGRQLGPQISPFLDTALEAFGPGGAMLGSDWPVSARTPRQVPYGQWFHTVLEHFALGARDEEEVRFGTARSAYKLNQPKGSTGGDVVTLEFDGPGGQRQVFTGYSPLASLDKEKTA